MDRRLHDRLHHLAGAREGETPIDLVKLIPMAIVMIAGPQIISAVFLATSKEWARNSAAYVLGASLSISIIVGAAFLLGIQLKESTSSDTVYWIILGLLLFLMFNAYRTRNTSEPPKWMGKLQDAKPSFSFKLGFLLLGVFPTDILTSVAVGSYLSSHNDPFWYYLGFLGLTLLLLATPGLLVLAMGERAKTLLPKVRDWMNTNSWVVSEFVLVLFVLITIDSIAG